MEFELGQSRNLRVNDITTFGLVGDDNDYTKIKRTEDDIFKVDTSREEGGVVVESVGSAEFVDGAFQLVIGESLIIEEQDRCSVEIVVGENGVLDLTWSPIEL